MKTLKQNEVQEWLDYIHTDLCPKDSIRVSDELALRVVNVFDALLAKDPDGALTIFGASRVPESSEERSLIRALLVHLEPIQYSQYARIEESLDGFYVKPFMNKVRALGEVL